MRLLALGEEAVASHLGCRASLLGEGSQPLAWTARLDSAGRVRLDTTCAGKPCGLVCDADGTDRWEDLLRLYARLVIDREPGQLQRGLRLADQPTLRRDAEGKVIDRTPSAAEFIEMIRREGYAPPPSLPAESWTDSMASAERFAGSRTRPGNHWSVVLTLVDPESSAFKDISALVRALRSSIKLETGHPLQTESERWLAAGFRFFARRIRRDAAGRTVRIKLANAR